MAYTKKPMKPPSGADFSALVNKVNELAGKVGVAKLSATVTGRIPLWKRYVGGEGPEFDSADEGGLRPVVNANALALDGLKGDHDALNQRVNNQDARLDALEAAPISRPFP